MNISFSGGPAVANAYIWLIPPARAQFLMQSRGRDKLTFAGAHLWLDFYWRNENGDAQALADVDFAIFKTTIADPTTNAPDLSPMDGQWDQPSTPAAFTSWEDDDDDGMYPFLWSHHIKGASPTNSWVGTYSPSLDAVNFATLIAPGSTSAPAYVSRKFLCTQEWQPDVVVRSKRRLAMGEGVILAMQCTTVVGQSQICEVKLRTLTS